MLYFFMVITPFVKFNIQADIKNLVKAQSTFEPLLALLDYAEFTVAQICTKICF